MADLLIPMLVLFGIIGLVLLGALVHQLRDLEPRSERPAPDWQKGGKASGPVLPWQRHGEEDAPDQHAPLWKRVRRDAPQEPQAQGRPHRGCSTCGGSGRTIVRSAGGGLEHGPCPDCQE